MAFLRVNGVAVKTPSTFSVGIQDISSSDSGRTLDGLMHKNRIGSKRTIELAWNNPTPLEVELIIKTFTQNEYFNVTYWDPINSTQQLTKTFYVGDISSPVKTWTVGHEVYSQVSFNIIER